MVSIEYIVSKSNGEQDIKLKEGNEIASSGRIWINSINGNIQNNFSYS